jgi:predicted nucleic acid-binding Zn ribbon protein
VIVPTLRNGEPTIFALEGALRHGLRSGLCLRGWSWAQADADAATIVSRALNRIGAKRPSWMQGQPDWADTAPSTRTSWSFTHCARCKAPLPEHDANRFYRRFCSDLCRSRTHTEIYQRNNAQEIAAKARAKRAANPGYASEVQRRYLAKLPPRQCESCGTMFQPKRLKGRFCSLKCRPTRGPRKATLVDNSS